MTRLSPRRVSELLEDPRESLDVEIKSWLDITGDNHAKATLAKAIIALANHGGGYIIIGMCESEGQVVPDTNRPGSLAGYNPDSVNAIVSRYVEPPFNCSVELSTSPLDDRQYPIVIVPGGHPVPIRSSRAGPGGEVMRENTYYIRRQGPQSEPPQSGREWDTLMRQCLQHAQSGLLDQFRAIMTGGTATTNALPTEQKQLEQWREFVVNRWQQVLDGQSISQDHCARMQHGRYLSAYQIISDDLNILGAQAFLDRMRRGVVRHTGWPPFRVPATDRSAPYPYEGNIECWMGGARNRYEPDLADFWIASPDGRFALIRGLDEDSENSGRIPGTVFDVSIPIWRIGEILLHAASMARQLNAPDARVNFEVEWTGLANRELVAIGNRLLRVSPGHIARQNILSSHLSVLSNEIEAQLPEIVYSLLAPLYEAFGFFELPEGLVSSELARMRGGV